MGITKKHAMDEDDFIDGYIDAALWAETDDDGEPFDANYDRDDIDDLTLLKMESDARDFWEQNWNILDEQDASRGGHNFWLTRNGHGAGFWDGDYPEYGDELTRRAKAFQEYDLYVGDDGKIYGTTF